jgi:hypothetical protein
MQDEKLGNFALVILIRHAQLFSVYRVIRLLLLSSARGRLHSDIVRVWSAYLLSTGDGAH